MKVEIVFIQSATGCRVMDFVVVYAYILDLILGDPRWFPHPVKIMGWIIQKLELPVRKIIRNQRLAGTVFVCVIIGLTWFVSFLVIQKTVEFNKYAGIFLSVLLIYTTISIKDLKDETMLVYLQGYKISGDRLISDTLLAC